MLNQFSHNSVFPARLIRHINKVDAFASVPVAPHMIEKLSTHELPRPSAGPGFSRRDAGGLGAELRQQAIHDPIIGLSALQVYESANREINY